MRLEVNGSMVTTETRPEAHGAFSTCNFTKGELVSDSQQCQLHRRPLALRQGLADTLHGVQAAARCGIEDKVRGPLKGRQPRGCKPALGLLGWWGGDGVWEGSGGKKLLLRVQ